MLPHSVHIVLLFTLAFTAFVLTILVTFTCPYISIIYFAKQHTDETLLFGVFGWCDALACSKAKAAYEYSSAVNRSLTGAMLLWPINTGLLLLVTCTLAPLLVWGEMAAKKLPFLPVAFQVLVNLSSLLSTTAWVLSVFGWSISLRGFALSGANNTRLGPAVWLALAATALTDGASVLGWPAQPSGADVKLGGEMSTILAPRHDAFVYYKKTTRDYVPSSAA